MGIVQDFYSMFSGPNRVKNGESVTDTNLVPELALSMSDDELIELTENWHKTATVYQEDIQKKQEDNRRYWMGQQFSTAETIAGHPLMENLIFEAVETFLPMATKKNPEPMVSADDTEDGKTLADTVQKMLVKKADENHLKLKIKSATRNWAIDMIGCAMPNWSEKKNDVCLEIVKPEDLLLDKDAYIDEDLEYTGEFVGRKKKEKASVLVQRFPFRKSFITSKVDGKMATKVSYIEWWTDEYVVWTLEKTVLGKAKNPNWNYDFEKESVDKFGEPTIKTIQGNNHFQYPKKPFVFLSIFSLKGQPHDVTSLIGQNLSLQDLINKRLRQFDENVGKTNGGLAISGDSGLNKEQAAEAAESFRNGDGVYVTSGDPKNVVAAITVGQVAPEIFQQQSDARDSLRNVFGVRGSSPSGTVREQTATGKSLVREQDSDRVGGGVSEYLEQFADAIYNHWVQLMYVYYEEEHSATVVGKERASEYIKLKNTDFISKLTISVKEGSLIPHDDVSEAEQAIKLAELGKIDDITLFDRLDYPNPREMAKAIWLQTNDPLTYFANDPEVAAVIQKQEAMALQAQQLNPNATV